MLVEAPSNGVDGGVGGDGGSHNSGTSSSSQNSDPPVRAPIIDVEARLAYTPPHMLIRSISSLSQHSLRPRTPDNQDEGGIPTLRKGVLLQARDRLFSRWKERYFVLTRDYLACFRRGSTKYSEMGSFIFKVNLASVEAVDWQDRRGGPVLALALPREGRVLLRAKSGLDQWHSLLRDATMASRQRRNALRRGTSTTHLNHLGLGASPRLGVGDYSLSDSTPEIQQLCDSVSSDTSPRPPPRADRLHRFSLLGDIDAGSYDTDVATPPSSVTSSHKFSSSTSNTSGSGGSSSLASSPSLRLRPLEGGAPRSRFSLYEGTREMPPVHAKTRYSVCVEPRELHNDLLSNRRSSNGTNSSSRIPNQRHSICSELGSSKVSLSMEPRNPLLHLLEETMRSSPPRSAQKPAPPPIPPSTRDAVETSPSPPSTTSHRPRAQSVVSSDKSSGMAPRSRTNLALFRHSALFN